jgi:hypothetical protein
MTVTTGTNINPRFNPVIASQIAVGYNNQQDIYILPQYNLMLLRSGVDHQRTAEFKKHERIWKRQTHHISSPVDKYLHPSYARIIGLGWPAVSHILRSLKRQPDDWFYALRSITGENPVPNSAAGDVLQMTSVWLKWGGQRGLI